MSCSMTVVTVVYNNIMSDSLLVYLATCSVKVCVVFFLQLWVVLVVFAEVVLTLLSGIALMVLL